MQRANSLKYLSIRSINYKPLVNYMPNSTPMLCDHTNYPFGLRESRAFADIVYIRVNYEKSLSSRVVSPYIPRIYVYTLLALCAHLPIIIILNPVSCDIRLAFLLARPFLVTLARLGRNECLGYTPRTYRNCFACATTRKELQKLRVVRRCRRRVYSAARRCPLWGL